MMRRVRSRRRPRAYSDVARAPEDSAARPEPLPGSAAERVAHDARAIVLVRAVAESERAALGELYDLMARQVLAFALRAHGTHRDAEDLVHDVFLEIWQRARDYDPARGSVRKWLLLRARSRVIDRLRSRHRAGAVALHEAAQRALLSAAHEVDLDLARAAATLRGSLLELPEDQRAVVELSYFAGYSSAEIARQLAIPIGTVESRMARALAQLRGRMCGPCGEGA